jgi:1-aminocyclopropane-1-carboxylate deaminase/D-cysteine desulfhydrase-like pyridoxal-dependent ACC family enzyme
VRTRSLALQREAAGCLPTWRGGAGRRTATAVKGGSNQTDPAAFAAAFREIVTRAHARVIGVIGGTITPYGGNGGWTAAREAVQQPVNDVTRYDGIFDAIGLTSTLTRFFVSVSSAGRDPLGFAFEWTPASRLITTRSVLRTEGRQ